MVLLLALHTFLELVEGLPHPPVPRVRPCPWGQWMVCLLQEEDKEATGKRSPGIVAKRKCFPAAGTHSEMWESDEAILDLSGG